MCGNKPFIMSTLPKRAGVGLKSVHFRTILDDKPDIGWFEIHPENYMGAGGPPHHYLTKIREDYPLSLHGVGLSIGGSAPLDLLHLHRLKNLLERYQPASFSEHLAWSSHTEGYLNDLLPLPYTDETLNVVCAHIDEVQNFLGRQMLLENPSTYVVFENSAYSEIDFITEIVRRTGCGLLLDVNNVYVSCTNHKRSPQTYIAEFPVQHVGEIHLAGHAQDRDDDGASLLIDSHDRPVIDQVWDLYEQAIRLTGPVATLIEWDDDIPEWSVLFEEAQKADHLMTGTSPMTKELHHAMA